MAPVAAAAGGMSAGQMAGLIGIQAGAQGTVNALNFGFNNWINKQNLRRQKQLYDIQLADQWEFWNAQNAYNDPANVMARARAAGINPFMAATGNAEPIPAARLDAPQAPHYQGYQFQADFTPVQQSLQAFYMNRKLEAETQGQLIENANQPLKNYLDNNRVEALTANMIQTTQNLKTTEDQIKAMTAKIGSETKNIEAETAHKNLLNLWQTVENIYQQKIKELQMEGMKAKNAETWKRVDEMTANIGYIEKKIDEISSIIDLNNANAFKAYQEAYHAVMNGELAKEKAITEIKMRDPSIRAKERENANIYNAEYWGHQYDVIMKGFGLPGRVK